MLKISAILILAGVVTLFTTYKPEIKEFLVAANELVGRVEKEEKRIASGDVDYVRKLLFDQPKAMRLPIYGGFSAAHIAAEHGQVEVLQILHKENINLEPKHKKSGYTPLVMAAMNGHINAVVFLVESGVNVKMKTRAGLTALDWAKARSHTEVIEYLESKESL